MRLLSACPLALTACVLVSAMANAAEPNILVNGSSADVTVGTDATLSVSVSLEAGSGLGTAGDWWVVAETPAGTLSRDTAGGWLSELLPAYQGALFDLPPLPLFSVNGLGAGTYTLYFGVDLAANGVLDSDTLAYDAIRITVTADGDGGDTGDAGDTGDSSDGDDTPAVSVKWIVPDTHQTGSYTTTPGEDSDTLLNPPSFTDNGNGTITDNVTGLMWTQSIDLNGDGLIDIDDKISYSEAPTHAASLTTGGYTDWRVPTIKELYSLMDFRGQDISSYTGTDTSGLTPFIDTGYFAFGYGDTASGERLIDSQMVTSTKYVSTTMNGDETMFGVNFADGRIKGYPIARKEFYAYFVRGETGYGENEFVDNGDGTVTDTATGKMWSRDDSGKGLNWEEALAWVNAKNAENYLGHNDWRLPNVKELHALVDYSRSPATSASAAIDPVFNTTEITNEGGEKDWPWFWSSTTALKYNAQTGDAMSDQAAYVCFGRALGYMHGQWMDVHGAGCQRTDPKAGDPADYPTGHGPQGDAIRIYNYVRLIRDL